MRVESKGLVQRITIPAEAGAPDLQVCVWIGSHLIFAELLHVPLSESTPSDLPAQKAMVDNLITAFFDQREVIAWHDDSSPEIVEVELVAP